jgi:hypothetical protein
MRLKCIKSQVTLLGYLFEKGNEYEILYLNDTEVKVITDYERYYEKTSLIANSYEWIVKGYKPENLHEVMPGYITTKEKDKLYTKKIKCKVATIKGDDDNEYEFLLMTNEEFIEKGAARRANGPFKGKPAFVFILNNILEDYFIDIQTIRNEKLKLLGL